jgi:hypothetical protein
MRKIVIAAGLAASLALFANPASAQYRHYQRSDQGEAIAGGLLGLGLGAALGAAAQQQQQAPPPGYYAAPQDEYNAPPPPDDPRSFCAAGFFWDGERCEAD